MTPNLFTIGHSNRSIEQLLALLEAHGITRVVDVRTAPGSRKNPQFTKDALAPELEVHGIRYTHLPALGGFRKPRPNSANAAWRNESFRGYADYMQTPEFEAALSRLLELAIDGPTAIMCAEAVPWRCHRSLIADALLARGFTAHHILSATRCDPHTLTSFARVERGRVTYLEEHESSQLTRHLPTPYIRNTKFSTPTITDLVEGGTMAQLLAGDSAVKIDQTDRKIISFLQADGRCAFSDIAKRLKVSEGTVRQRYQRLVNTGVLQVVGVADPFKVGFHSMAMIGVKVAIDAGRSIDDVAREVTDFPEVSYVVMSTGDFDLLVEVIMENNEDFVEFLTSKLHRVDGIKETETFMLLRVYKMSLGGWRMVETRSG